jgi:GNAT superfamily N-acetyltransferase
MLPDDLAAKRTREPLNALAEHDTAPVAATTPKINPAWQWTPAEEDARYGLHFSTGGDTVPGGYNYTFSAEDPQTGERLGLLSLNTTGKDAVIAHVEVNPDARGRGVATKLLRYAHDYEPEMTISHGLQTDEGVAWVQKLPDELKQNPIPPLSEISIGAPAAASRKYLCNKERSHPMADTHMDCRTTRNPALAAQPRAPSTPGNPSGTERGALMLLVGEGAEGTHAYGPLLDIEEVALDCRELHREHWHFAELNRLPKEWAADPIDTPLIVDRARIRRAIELLEQTLTADEQSNQDTLGGLLAELRALAS